MKNCVYNFYKILKMLMFGCLFVYVLTASVMATNDDFTQCGSFVDAEVVDSYDYEENVICTRLWLKVSFAIGAVYEYECGDKVEIDGVIYSGAEEILQAIQFNRYVEFKLEGQGMITQIRYPEVVPIDRKINYSTTVLSRNDNITANINFNYITDNCIVVMGIYDENNVLLNCNIREAKITDKAVDISGKNPENGKKDLKIKIYILSCLEKCIPLCPMQSFWIGACEYAYVNKTNIDYKYIGNERIGINSVNYEVITQDGIKILELADEFVLYNPMGGLEEHKLSEYEVLGEYNFYFYEVLNKEAIGYKINNEGKICVLVTAGHGDYLRKIYETNHSVEGEFDIENLRFKGEYTGYIDKNTVIYAIDSTNFENSVVMMTSDLIDGEWYDIYGVYASIYAADADIIIIDKDSF